MEDLLKKIAAAEGLEIKVVAKIFKEGFIKWLDARFYDLNIWEIREELDAIIYKN